MYLKVALSIELEGIFFEDKARHFSEVMCRYGRVVFVKSAVCFASKFNTLPLWYVFSIDTRNVRFFTLDFSINFMKSVVSFR